MTSLISKRIDAAFKKVSHIEDRDEGALDFRNYLVSQNVEKQLAANLATVMHQSLLHDNADEIVKIIYEDEILIQLFERWTDEKSNRT